MRTNQRQKTYQNEAAQKAAEELSTYSQLKAKAKALQEKAEYYRDRAMVYGGCAMDGIRVQGGKKDRLAEYVVEWADMEHQAELANLEAEKECMRIELKLSLLQAAEYQVLYFYYLKGHTIQEIAKTMDYAYVTVINLKARALKNYYSLGNKG